MILKNEGEIYADVVYISVENTDEYKFAQGYKFDADYPYLFVKNSDGQNWKIYSHIENFDIAKKVIIATYNTLWNDIRAEKTFIAIDLNKYHTITEAEK